MTGAVWLTAIAAFQGSDQDIPAPSASRMKANTLTGRAMVVAPNTLYPAFLAVNGVTTSTSHVGFTTGVAVVPVTRSKAASAVVPVAKTRSSFL